jgi:hypothetical protein
MTTDSQSYARPQDTLAVALTWNKKFPGHFLFPLPAGEKSPPPWKNYRDLASNNPAQLRKWAKEFPGCNWGLALERSNIQPLDVDRKEGKNGEATYDMLVEKHGGLPPTFTVITPSGGWHFYFKGKHVFKNNIAGPETHIDSPHYVLIPGCRLNSGGEYQIADGCDVPIAPAPAWFAEYLKPTEKSDNAGKLSNPMIDEGLSREMLFKLDPAKYQDQTEWFNLMCSFHYATGGHGLDDFREWSLSDTTYTGNTDNIGDRWRSLEMKGQTEYLFFERVRAAAPILHIKAIATADFSEPPPDDSYLDALRADWKRRDAERAKKRPDKAKAANEAVAAEEPFPAPLSMKQLLRGKWEKPKYLVDGLVLQGYPQTINADGGTGKTTVCTQFGVGVAAGVPVFGRMAIQAPVLLVLGEDGEAVTQERVQAAVDRSAELAGVDPETLPLTTWVLQGRDMALAKISDQGVIELLPFYEKLDAMMATTPGCFVVLDSLIDVVQMEMKDPAPANAFFKKLLTGLCKKHDATILVLAHPSKASMADGSWSHGTLAMKNAVRNSLAMRKVEGQEYRVLWRLKGNYGGEDEIKLYFEYPIFTLTPPSASENPAVRRDAAILEYIVQMIREGKASVTRNNRGGGTTPRMIAEALNSGGMQERSVTWQQVQTVMVRAENNGVLRYVKGYGKTEAHYEWLGDDAGAAEPTDDDGDFGA